MLAITVPENELWDEEKQEFISIKEQTLQLEHSLVSLSKWESKWHKAFLGKQEKTYEESLDYIRCMTITQHVKPEVYRCLMREQIDEIYAYIAEDMTAIHFSDNKKAGGSREPITSEIIYYWMIALNVPTEFQKWHLSRLIALIRVCEIKNAPPKKMSRRELASRNAAINAARRKRLNSKG